MLTVKLMLDYKCYPTWIYNEKYVLVNNYLPEELINNDKIEELFNDIQEEFDSLFIDDGIEFKFKGFQDEKSRYMFKEKVDNAYELIKNELKDKYIILNTVCLDNF